MTRWSSSVVSPSAAPPGWQGRRRTAPGRGLDVTDCTMVEGPTTTLLEEIEEANTRLQTAPASHVIAWAVERFGRKLALAASFQDVVLIDLAVDVDPGIEVALFRHRRPLPRDPGLRRGGRGAATT